MMIMDKGLFNNLLADASIEDINRIHRMAKEAGYSDFWAIDDDLVAWRIAHGECPCGLEWGHDDPDHAD